ncbi:MAG: hypothetical protein HFG48_01960 [Bacilli bacterium]|nr:hypothetical protein [Bacilli bacterium]
MKEKIIEAVGNKLDSLGVVIDDVYVVNEDNEKTLTIVLDREEVIPLNTIVMATRILNPIIDKLDLIEESYTLDIYAKSKEEGDE